MKKQKLLLPSEAAARRPRPSKPSGPRRAVLCRVPPVNDGAKEVVIYGTSTFYHLPAELMVAVLGWVDAETLRRSRTVDRYWGEVLSHDDDVWKAICRRDPDAAAALATFDAELWRRCKEWRLWPCRSPYEWLYWSERPTRIFAVGLAFDKTDTRRMIGIGRADAHASVFKLSSRVAGEWLGTYVHGYARERFDSAASKKYIYVPERYEGIYEANSQAPTRGVVVYHRGNFGECKKYTGPFFVRRVTGEFVPHGRGTFINDDGRAQTFLLADGMRASQWAHDRNPSTGEMEEIDCLDSKLRRQGRVIELKRTEPDAKALTRYEHIFVDDVVVRQYIVEPDGSGQGGPIVDGGFTGEGFMIFEDGLRYDGAFVDGWMHGFGCEKLANGDVYTGAFVHGDRVGHGTLMNKKERSATFEGDFVDGKFSSGLIRYANGDVYEGPAHNYRPHGHGMMRLQVEERRVVADFVDGVATRGVVEFLGAVTGQLYEGELHGARFVRHGTGTMRWPQLGAELRGEFRDDKPVRGHLTYARSGASYTGDVDAEGRPCGAGVYRWADGATVEGVFSGGGGSVVSGMVTRVDGTQMPTSAFAPSELAELMRTGASSKKRKVI